MFGSRSGSGVSVRFNNWVSVLVWDKFIIVNDWVSVLVWVRFRVRVSVRFNNWVSVKVWIKLQYI